MKQKDFDRKVDLRALRETDDPHARREVTDEPISPREKFKPYDREILPERKEDGGYSGSTNRGTATKTETKTRKCFLKVWWEKIVRFFKGL